MKCKLEDNIPDCVCDEIKSFIKNHNDISFDYFSLKGGNGDIFFGMHNILKTRVALKVYYIDQDRFAHEEAKVLHSISHDNILKVLDAKEISKQYAYFLTPEINGGDLENLLQHKISIKQALKIIQGILTGLSVLHHEKNRIVHRDLKPANILITKNTFIPMIADFGSIKSIPNTEESINASRGSDLYKPPEAFNNTYSFNSDLYQVGIILYELLGGILPKSINEILNVSLLKKYNKTENDFEKCQIEKKGIQNLICQNKLLNFNSLPIYVNDKIINIIKKATNKDFEKRYKSTSIFLNDLYNIDKSTADWSIIDDYYKAVLNNGETFRIVSNSKKIKVEKLNNSQWSSFNRFGENLSEIITQINDRNGK